MAQLSAAWEKPEFDPLLRPLIERAVQMDEDLSILQHNLNRSRHRLLRRMPVDYDSWADDLERAAGHVVMQEFDRADALLARWSWSFSAGELDETGMWLCGRSLMLMGDAQRDRGHLTGPWSAGFWYARAGEVFSHLHEERRLAQAALALTVVDEMTGQVVTAADRYRSLSQDERLSRRDRARAQLWMGTSLTKQQQHEDAVSTMVGAARAFDDLNEPDDWAVSQQKIGLALRSSGQLDDALHHIEIARDLGHQLMPLQRVRLDTAHAHCLLSDRETRTEGHAMLARSRDVAARHGLAHQLRSIESIGAQFD